MQAMDKYYFGSMDEYIEVGYAPTSRANCRQCKAKIEKDTVRVGQCVGNDHFFGRLWHHLSCFKLKPLFRGIDIPGQLYNLEELGKKDQQEVIEHLKQELQRLLNTKKSRSARKSSKKQKQKENEQEEKEEKVEETKKEMAKSGRRTTRSQSRPKSQKKEVSPSPKRSKSKAKKKKTASTKKSAKKKEKIVVEEGYNSEQKQKFKQLVEKYMKMSTEKLKEILLANNQTKTGNKSQLAEKCADGELLGRIPSCPECGGGKLRFKWKAALYNCPGFMDDVDFRNCNKIFTMKEIVREPWVMP